MTTLVVASTMQPSWWPSSKSLTTNTERKPSAEINQKEALDLLSQVLLLVKVKEAMFG
jgi:hypothetical protein